MTPASPAQAALRLRQDCLIKKNLLSEAIILVVIRPNIDPSFSRHDRFCGGPLNVGGPGERASSALGYSGPACLKLSGNK